MNYSFQILDTDALTWVTATPEHKDFDITATLNYNEANITYKTGTLTFYGTDFNRIYYFYQQTFRTPARVYINNVLVQTLWIDLLNAEVDDDRKKIKVSTKPITDADYIYENLDTGKNIYALGLTRYTCISTQFYEALEYKIDAFTDSPSGSLFISLESGTINIYARQKITVTSLYADLLMSQDVTWSLISDNGATKTIGRNYTSVYGVPSFGTDVISKIGYANLGYQINDIVYSADSKIPYIFLANKTGEGVAGEAYLVDINVYYGAITFEYSRCRSLIDVIKGMLGGVYNIDESGTSTDSFYYLKSYQNSLGEYTLRHLFISQVTDFIFTESNVPKSNEAIVWNLTFRKLFDFLNEQLSITWQLEDRSGNIYFVLKHATELTQTNGDIDLTNYYQTNWTARKNVYKKDTSLLWQRIKRTTTANTYDFVGTDIYVSQTVNQRDKLINQTTFFVDVVDSQNNKQNYPNNSTNQFFVLSCNSQSGLIYQCLRTVGALSLRADVPNVALSIANTDAEHFAFSPYSTVNINNTETTLNSNRIIRTKVINYDCPFFEIDSSKLINTDLDWAKIKTLSYRLNNELAQIELYIL